MDIKRVKQFIVKELEVHNNECSDSETCTPVRFYLRHRNLSIRKIFQEASSFSKALSMDERVSEICNSQSIGAAIENMTLEVSCTQFLPSAMRMKHPRPDCGREQEM